MSLLPLHSSSAFGTTIQDNLTILIDLDNSALGPTSEKVSSAVRHLCGIKFPNDEFESLNLDNFYEIAKDYYRQIKHLDPTGRQLLSFLSYLSGYYHELRHAHDLLATTYGQGLLHDTFDCYQNFPSVMTALSNWLSEDEGRRIPIPLSENLDLLADLPEDLKKLMSHYSKIRSNITGFQHPQRASPAGLTTIHLLECSAFDIQIDFIHDVFGDEAVFVLTEFVQRGQRSRVYLQIRNELAETFYARGFRGWGLGTIINYLLWSSLVGTTFPGQKVNEGPNSVILCEALVEHVIRNAVEMELPVIRKLVQDFFDYWGFLTTEQMISRVNQELVKRVAKLEKAWKRLGEEGIQLDFVKAYESFANAYSRMNQWIEGNPMAYFGQRNYVWCVMGGLLPSVHLKVKLNGSVYDFMSKGYEIIPFDAWENITFISTMFKLLVQRRIPSSRSFFENICLNILNKKIWNGVQLKFMDRSDFFN